MGQSALECTVGCVVSEAETVHDYIQLGFDTGARLSIYNDYIIQPSDRSLRDLRGLNIVEVTTSSEAETIEFGDGSTLTVDLRSDAFRGPEAMQLQRNGADTIIWN